LSSGRGGQFFATTILKESDMQINLTGHHVEVTPALRDYVKDKLQRISRHFDHVISINVVLKVEKHNNDAEATLHAAGKSLFANASDLDMYAAIDGLVDKLDKQVKRYKERLREHQASRDDRSVSPE
jgi:putative sigma-54 modulation protein